MGSDSTDSTRNRTRTRVKANHQAIGNPSANSRQEVTSASFKLKSSGEVITASVPKFRKAALSLSYDWLHPSWEAAFQTFWRDLRYIRSMLSLKQHEPSL